MNENNSSAIIETMALKFICDLCHNSYDARISLTKDIAYNEQDHEVSVGRPDDPCDKCAQRLNTARDAEEQRIREEANAQPNS